MAIGTGRRLKRQLRWPRGVKPAWMSLLGTDAIGSRHLRTRHIVVYLTLRRARFSCQAQAAAGEARTVAESLRRSGLPPARSDARVASVP